MTRKFHNNLLAIPIMHDWGFGRLANSLEECGFASIGSPDDENAESPEPLSDSSSAFRHDSNTVDVRKCGSR